MRRREKNRKRAYNKGYGKNAGTTVRLYRVRLRQSELWPDYAGQPQDELQIEIYEHWLEKA